MSQEKIILRHFHSLGDVVMLTAAVRDIHLSYPNRFLTDVRTPFPDLWTGNPYITPLHESDSDVEIIDCHYSNIHGSNQVPKHFVHAFIDFLNARMGLNIEPRFVHGDIHLESEEIDTESLVESVLGRHVPYWLIVSGGKHDCTVKWWHYKRYQEVVDRLAGARSFRTSRHARALSSTSDRRS